MISLSQRMDQIETSQAFVDNQIKDKITILENGMKNNLEKIEDANKEIVSHQEKLILLEADKVETLYNKVDTLEKEIRSNQNEFANMKIELNNQIEEIQKAVNELKENDIKSLVEDKIQIEEKIQNLKNEYENINDQDIKLIKATIDRLEKQCTLAEETHMPGEWPNSSKSLF